MTPPHWDDGEKQNYSASAYRVLLILLLLMQHRALSLGELNRLLADHEAIGRTFNSETITKYINTLRSVGCNIPYANRRNRFCYSLLQNPFPLGLSAEELSVAGKIARLLAEHDDEELFIKYHNLLQRVGWLLAEEQKQLLNECLDSPGPNGPDRPSGSGTTGIFPSDAVQEQARRYKQWCRDGQVLMLDMKLEVGASQPDRLMLEPQQVSREGRSYYLTGVDRLTQQRVKLQLSRISYARQLPSRVHGRSKQVTVVFQVTGRLAKTYRPYPKEEVLSSVDQSVRVVKARTDDTMSLVRRLLKYGTFCEVLSPAYVREALRQEVERLMVCLKNGRPGSFSGIRL
jgi:predicted DNA-binding transcriptional regulator YafY